MITNTEIRNALTGALAVMALGLFASCSDNPVAPADDGVAVHAPAANTVQGSLQSCALVDGVWVCTSGGGGATTTSGDRDQECFMIAGVMHCSPIGGA